MYSHSKQTICNNSWGIDTRLICPIFLKKTMAKATDIQIGGEHYKLPIQPVEYIWKNNLNFFQGNIIKYTSRYKAKGGKEDLLKARHYIDMLIEFEYGNEQDENNNE